MGAIKQYTDFYAQNRVEFAASSPELLTRLREQAAEAIMGKELPTTRTEGYDKTSIEAMFAPDYGINLRKMNFPVDLARAFKCDVPNLSTLLGVVVNDRFAPTSTLEKNLPEGVTVCSLACAAEEFPGTLGEYLGRIAPKDNAGVALNTMLMTDGVFIRVERGVKVSHPIQIVNIFSAPVSLMASRRILIVMEEDSEASVLLCDHTQNKELAFLGHEVAEVICKKGSRLDMVSLEESSELTSRWSQLYCRLDDSSDFNINTTTLLNGTTRNEFHVDIAGERVEAELSGMVALDGERIADNFSNVNHLAPHSRSNQLFKYLVSGKATGAFEGGIYVSPDAPFTEGYQSNRNILASEDARMFTRPQLLIYNDEVKCNHGAATGQLDASQLFYMQTRGIPLETARQLLMQAFMTDAIAKIRIEPVRTRLAMLIEKRLNGSRESCSGNCLEEKC